MLDNQLLLEQGLMSRCLVAWPGTTAGTRDYREIGLLADVDIQRYHNRLVQILETSLPLKEGTRNKLNPRSLTLEPDAKYLWVGFHDYIEHQLQDHQPLAVIRGFANKTAEHAARLAGILTLILDLEAHVIKVEHMSAGITLVQFYLSEALRLFESATADPDLILAEKLLAWAQQREGPVYMPLIYQYGPSGIRDAKTARRMVGILEEHGWLTRMQGTNIDGAHRREVWSVFR